MMNLDHTKMQQVIQAAFDKVQGSRRWQPAIVKAKQQLESNPDMHYDGHALLLLSESGEIYEANGVCQCKAYQHGQPCFHRAAYKLVKRYREISHYTRRAEECSQHPSALADINPSTTERN